MTVPPLGHTQSRFRRWVSSSFGFLAASMRNVGSGQGSTGYEVML
jgi:hypothetical protein